MGQYKAPGALDPTVVAKSAAFPYQKEVLTEAAERALRPWAPYGNGMGERQGAVLAHLGPAAMGTAAGMAPDDGIVAAAGGIPPTPTALYGIVPEAAKAIGEAAGRVSDNHQTIEGKCLSCNSIVVMEHQ